MEMTEAEQIVERQAAVQMLADQTATFYKRLMHHGIPQETCGIYALNYMLKILELMCKQ